MGLRVGPVGRALSVSPRFGTCVLVCANRCAATSLPLRKAAIRRQSWESLSASLVSSLRDSCTPRPTLQKHHGREQGRVNRENSAKTCRQSEREGKRLSLIYLSLSLLLVSFVESSRMSRSYFPIRPRETEINEDLRATEVDPNLRAVSLDEKSRYSPTSERSELTFRVIGARQLHRIAAIKFNTCVGFGWIR